jgi:hypothetical protein
MKKKIKKKKTSNFKLKIPIEDWVWYGHAGHFICSYRCLFRLATKIGPYLISTVGDQSIKGSSSPIPLGITEDELFETMVFSLEDAGECKCGCDQAMPTNWEELYVRRYSTSALARQGHMEVCLKFAKEE